MAYEWDNDCVGCDYCINCGRGTHKVWYCDKCGFCEGTLYKGENGEDLCWECYCGQFESRILEAGDDTLCANCGRDNEELFLVDGEWICEDCLRDMAETIDTEG